ncbi:hypothetical protein NB037_03195 [Rathayibacter sp. ZW T2_19]|uniref:Uncharacterized protein n=1 Tax=Rathayibacter rubneri TaxID=2950106 RepID=A0A9X2IT90_9MICO|nr:hypothetical protein [Rathayibacter rubneri]MCM6761414.1 hypothetical protein [Rathayibacter rubneri]
MTAATATATVRPSINPERAALLDLIERAEARIIGIRNVVGTAYVASGAPTHNTFAERVSSAGGGLLATHYAGTVLGMARSALTTHPAGSLEPHLLGFAESIARSVLGEYREASAQ